VVDALENIGLSGQVVSQMCERRAGAAPRWRRVISLRRPASAAVRVPGSQAGSVRRRWPATSAKPKLHPQRPARAPAAA
jgi:hypothetical protein